QGITVAGTEAPPALAARFGSEILAPDGAVDRAKLGKLVFADPVARRDLEQITHPAVYRAIAAGLRAFERLDNPALAVVDVPLLYETGRASDFDRVIVTVCPSEVQLARLLERGMSESEANQRMAAQWPTDQKAARADFVIHTEGAFDDTNRQVARILDDLTPRVRGPGTA